MRLRADVREQVIADFADYTGYDPDGCEILYRDGSDDGTSLYQVVDAEGRSDGTGMWHKVEIDET